MNSVEILLTNDDGPKSPALRCFAEAIQNQPWCSKLNLVVPNSERSWVAQAVTRFGALDVESISIGSVDGKTVSGTPADCASLGTHNLSDNRPDLVLSGPNMGVNAGLPFYLSSGTIGGAVEGFLSGVPAAAVSIDLPHEVYIAWTNTETECLNQLEDTWKRIAQEGAAVVDDLLKANAWENADIISINLPWEVNEFTPRKFTRLKRGRFGAIFQKISGSSFKHDLQELSFDESSPILSENSIPDDLDIVRQGDISITLIQYAISAAPSAKLRGAIERNR